MIYKVGYFDLSTLITQKRSIFSKKHKRGSCKILREEKLVTLNLTLKTFSYIVICRSN